jgi:SAM-dependent methyltransferase
VGASAAGTGLASACALKAASAHSWAMHPIFWRWRFSGRRPGREEVREFIVRQMPKRAVVAEIGVDLGDFSETILALSRPRELHLIDPWTIESGEYRQRLTTAPESAANSPRALDSVARYDLVRDRFASDISGGTVILHRADSVAAAEEFADGHFDWVYIDGNHSYEFVRRDLELYYRKLKPGGYMVCDDYHHAGFWEDGVTRAADEFIASKRVRRVFKRRSQLVMRKPVSS